MSSKFIDRSPLVLRALGALIGGGFGMLLLLLAAVTQLAAQFAFGVLVLVLGGLLGWLFAPRAARPGTLNVAGTAGLITALAVPIGALLFTLLLLLGAIADSGVGAFARFGVLEVVGGVVGIALFGLVLYGLPMAGLTFVVASIWVFLVRFAVARLSGAQPGQAPEPSAGGPT